MKKIFAFLITAILFAGLLSGCGDPDGGQKVNIEEGTLPLGKYEEEITLTVGQMVSATKYISGETASNNIMYDICREVMNIKFVSKFSANIGTAYNYQLNMAMLSNDLPDLFFSSQSQLAELIDQELVYDLTEVYEEYASPMLRLAMEYNYTGDAAVWNDGNPSISKEPNILGAATVNGRLYGIPFLADLFDNCPLVWIRSDWLKVWAEENSIPYDPNDLKPLLPKNFQEYLDLVEYFSFGDPDGDNQANTYGLGIGYNTENLQGLANVYGAAPGYYLKDGNGDYVYGTDNEGSMRVVQLLNELYRTGQIDRNSALDGQLLKQALAAGKIGSFVGAYWSIMSYGLNDAYLVNNSVDWIPWAVLDFDGNVIEPMVPYNINNNSFYCISSDCKYPEALIIFANHLVEQFFTCEGDFAVRCNQAANDPKYKNVASEMGMYLPVRMDAPNKNIRYAFDIQKAMETNDFSELNISQMTYYNRIKAFMDDPTGDGKQYYAYYKIFAKGGAYDELTKYADYDYEEDKYDLKVNFMRPAYSGIATQVMNSYNSIIKDYEYQELVYLFTQGTAVTQTHWNTFISGLYDKGMREILDDLNK